MFHVPGPGQVSASSGSIAIVNAFADLITRVGFPVVVAVYLLTQSLPRLEAISEYQQRQVAQMAILSNACAPRTVQPGS